MNAKKYILFYALLLSPVLAPAALVVSVNHPKATGNKTVIRLELENTFSQSVESARATMFLLDDQGKVIGRSARWVIGGGNDKPAVAPDQKSTFNFVITTPAPLMSTNLQAQVIFNRVVLEGGKLADVIKEVSIQPASK